MRSFISTARCFNKYYICISTISLSLFLLENLPLTYLCSAAGNQKYRHIWWNEQCTCSTSAVQLTGKTNEQPHRIRIWLGCMKDVWGFLQCMRGQLQWCLHAISTTCFYSEWWKYTHVIQLRPWLRPEDFTSRKSSRSCPNVQNGP